MGHLYHGYVSHNQRVYGLIWFEPAEFQKHGGQKHGLTWFHQQELVKVTESAMILFWD